MLEVRRGEWLGGSWDPGVGGRNEAKDGPEDLDKQPCPLKLAAVFVTAPGTILSPTIDVFGPSPLRSCEAPRNGAFSQIFLTSPAIPPPHSVTLPSIPLGHEPVMSQE